MRKIAAAGLFLIALFFSAARVCAADGRVWSLERADAWYAKQPWPVGSNFIPSTAINELEMWQADTFDLPTIDRELGRAQSWA